MVHRLLRFCLRVPWQGIDSNLNLLKLLAHWNPGLNLGNSMTAAQTSFAEDHRQYLGARLRAVEDVGMEELLLRTRVYYGADSIYGTLAQLANYEFFLAKKAVLEDLLPEWRDKSVIRISLLMPNGESKLISLATGPLSKPKVFHPDPGIELPPLDGLEFGWGFLDDQRNTAYLRVLRMEKNRETYEKRANWSDVSEEVQDFYHSINEDEAELPYEEALAALPSLTEAYTGLFRQMKNAGSRSLIIDLRTNIGGWALSADILVYFLYGKQALIEVHRRTNIATRKLSPEYFADDPEMTLEEINELAVKNGSRSFDLADYDYDFSDPAKIHDDLLELEYTREMVEDDLALSPTFFAEYRTGTHSKYYTPENIIVVTNSVTFSSGFMFAQSLKLLGAKVVGGVPSQNIGQMGEVMHYKLDHSGLGGAISRSYLVHDTRIPDSEVAASVLEPDYELDYEKLREFGFSRPAAVRYALEILNMDKESRSEVESDQAKRRHP